MAPKIPSMEHHHPEDYSSSSLLEHEPTPPKSNNAADNSLCQTPSPEKGRALFQADEEDDDDDHVSVTRQRRAKNRPAVAVGGDQEDDDDDDTFMMRIVHGSCQGVFPDDGGGGTAQPSMCMSACSLDDQLDLLTHCRHPLAFLSFFPAYHHHQSSSSADGHEHALPPGAYTMPAGCEYCGAESDGKCRPHCRRPALFFQKKRPPFQKADAARWDPVTDEPVAAPEPASGRRAASPMERTASWLSGILLTSRRSPTTET